MSGNLNTEREIWRKLLASDGIDDNFMLVPIRAGLEIQGEETGHGA